MTEDSTAGQERRRSSEPLPLVQERFLKEQDFDSQLLPPYSLLDFLQK